MLGAATGWIVAILVDNQSRYQTLQHILVAVAGAISSGAAATFLARASIHSFSLYSVAVSVIGAGLLLMIYRISNSMHREVGK